MLLPTKTVHNQISPTVPIMYFLVFTYQIQLTFHFSLSLSGANFLLFKNDTNILKKYRPVDLHNVPPSGLVCSPIMIRLQRCHHIFLLGLLSFSTWVRQYPLGFPTVWLPFPFLSKEINIAPKFQHPLVILAFNQLQVWL